MLETHGPRRADFYEAGMAEKLVLFGAHTGNCLRAAIALSEAGIQYSPVRIDLRRGEQSAAGFLQLNPAGKVPVLAAYRNEELLWTLTQSNAIMLDAAARSPGRLLPLDQREIARTLELYFHLVTDVIVPNQMALTLDWQGLGDGSAALAALAIQRAESCESFLEHSPYMVGERFSIADIAAYTALHTLRHSIRWGDLPLLSDWFSRTGMRPSVRQGMVAF